MRFISASADLEVGDLLTTSGVDGIYPPGLPVAHIHSITHQGDGGFARVLCQPMARPEHSLQLLVLEPLNDKPLRNPEGSKR